MVAAVTLIGAVACSDGDGHSRGTTASTKPRSARVTVTLDDAGLHVPKPSVPAGDVVVSFVDRRRNPAGAAMLEITVHPRLGVVGTLSSGEMETVLLCPQAWYVGVQIDGVLTDDGWLVVSGRSRLCTTPIT
jgi:hypothetical protein